MIELSDLLARGEAALLEAKERSEFEGLHLDFKGAGDSLFTADGKLQSSGRKALAKAVSAFSNAGGGLIIIGVDARVDDGKDTIVAVTPVTNFIRAASAVNSALGDLVEPRVNLLLHRIPVDHTPDAGYLVIEVPRSERRPHQSIPDHQYYRRSGSSSYPMNHFEIEDAFRRIAAPDLSLWFTREVAQYEAGTPLFGRAEPRQRIRFRIRNDGAATAKHLTLAFVYGTGPHLTIPKSDRFQVYEAAGRLMVVGPADLVVNPGQLCDFHFGELQWMASERPVVPPPIELNVQIGAENMLPQSTGLTIPFLP
jgi:hypothetical protein